MGERSTTPPVQKPAGAAELAALRVEAVKERRRAEALQREVMALRDSLSWRLTAPLRFIAGAFMKPHQWLLRILYESPAFSWVGKPLAKAVYVWGLPGTGILVPLNPLFSFEFYSESNRDLRTDRDLWAHYLGFGGDEGRDPHPMFSTSYYLRNNVDVGSSRLNALVHYFAYGAAENRFPHPSFDPGYYLKQRRELKLSGMNPLLHYWEYGRHEGLRAVGPKAPALVPSQAAVTYRGLRTTAVRPGSMPVFSILLPTFNTPAEFLRLAIGSVLRQTYPHWQLCMYDDGSSSKDTLAVLKKYAAMSDSRIVVEFGKTNLGIARASNAALALARGDYVGMLDHDDELDLDALKEVAEVLNRDPSLDVVYTDQDYIDAHGSRIGTLLKPDWSPEMFRGVMFVNHLLVVRAELARRVGAFDPAFDCVQDFEFMLRVSEKTDKIGHVRRILYHWRSIPGSVAAGANSKGVLEPLQAAAVNAHLSRCGIGASAAPNPVLSHRLILRPAQRSTFPRVLIAIRDVKSESLAQTAQSIVSRSTYPNLTVCVPAPLSGAMPEDRRICSRALDDVHRELADDDFLVWIDGDLEIVTPNWIESLLMYCEQRDVGCASPLIVSEGTVWSAGLVLAMSMSAGAVMRGLAPDSDGYAGSLSCSREVSAVSGECMMIHGAVFRHLGGNVKYYSSSVLDGADLALRGAAVKKRNIVTPRAVLEKHGSGPVPQDWKLDEELFVDRWSDLIRAGDPFYNSNFLATMPGYAVEATTAGVGA
jgi:O-antigen biosynthesis protein